MRFRFLCFLFLLVLSPSIHAQSPAYYLLGEDVFSGVQIYDVIQDRNKDYWIATNDGLYSYNFSRFEKKTIEQSSTQSLFGFVQAKDGSIFCHNLNYQLFRIEGGRCRLFYELQGEEKRSELNITIAEDGNLLVAGGEILALNMKAEVKARYRTNNTIPSSFFTLNGATSCHLKGKELVTYKNGGFQKEVVDLPSSAHPEILLRFFSIKGKTYAYDASGLVFYSLLGKKLTEISCTFDSRNSLRTYQTKNSTWFAGHESGVYRAMNSLQNAEKLFTDYFISDVYEDAEENLILSTFDHGLIVVSDIEAPVKFHPFSDNYVRKLFVDDTFGLLAGTEDGSILRVNDKITELLPPDGKSSDGLYGFPGAPNLVVGRRSILAYNKRTGVSTVLLESGLKDAIFVGANRAYVGTNFGLFECVFDGNGKPQFERLPDLKFRVYAMAYDPFRAWLYVSTSNGLYLIDDKGKSQRILRKKKAIYGTSLYFYKGELYISNPEYGIIVVRGDSIKREFTVKQGSEKSIFKKILIHDNALFGLSSEGVFMTDLFGKSTKVIHQSIGIRGAGISDICLSGDQLFISHAKGITQLKIDYVNRPVKIPSVVIRSLHVNNLQSSLDKVAFESDQRRFSFEIAVPTLRHRENLRCFYRLEGYEKTWNLLASGDNKIEYSALAPGSYTLYVRADGFGQNGKTVRYSFTIEAPFYQKAWFIGFCVLVFVFFVSLVYRWQLRIQKKKAHRMNELQASRLSAIQSQMNPHFIFNSLSSIQDQILKGEVEASYSYITTFSNLVRRTMNYSSRDLIDFEEEIMLLELYLELEGLRFRNSLEYHIDYERIEGVRLPPLLIQPFVENALIHGLLHSEAPRILWIRFVLEDHLICVIEDNGIGREEAQNIRKRAGHESFSGKAIQHRLAILSEIYRDTFGCFYEDLVDENGNARGTRVTLKIPVERVF